MSVSPYDWKLIDRVRVLGPLVRRMQRIFQIHTGQNGKDVGLDEGNKHLKAIHCGDRDHGHRADHSHSGKACEHFDHGVTGHHVACKTNAVAHRANKVRNHFDHGQYWTQRQRRAGHPEQAKEACAVFHKSNNSHGYKHQQREHDGHGKVGCGCEGARDQAQEVGHHDKHEQRHDIWEELDGVFASHVFDHFVDEAIGQLTDGLSAAWDNRAATGAHNHHGNNRHNCQRHPQGDIGDGEQTNLSAAKQWLHQKLIHWVEF
mmetsp:Transcript_28456/g.53263  ORF Transcript_28456/g.53263 Transcript_28456/m.53263 type:complete len:260 (+) Transcript_28456:1434-2213(+)